jgi:glucokinase
MGATHLRAGLLHPGGRRLAGAVRHAIPADPGARADLLRRVAQSFGPVDAAGVAIAGTVADGIVTWTANLGLDGLDIRAMLRQVIRGSVVVVNDARAAGIAAARAQAAAGERVVLAVTVGTGIGGSIVVDGAPLPGTGNAGEIGHVVIRADGPPCGCGRRGCWETLCGGRALDRAAALALGDPAARAADLAVWAQRTPAAATALAQAAAAFRTGLDSLCAVLAPHLIVLGGGVLARDGAVARAYLAAAQRLRWSASARIARSALGDDAGMLGAATLAAESI